jgi:hypothetical protein
MRATGRSHRQHIDADGDGVPIARRVPDGFADSVSVGVRER